MAKGGDYTKMSGVGFVGSLLGAVCASRLKIRLGANAMDTMEAQSARLAKSVAEAGFNGDASGAGKAMAVKLVVDCARAVRVIHSDPALARALAADAIRQCAVFYDKGKAPMGFKEAMTEAADAMERGSAPARRMPALKELKELSDMGFVTAAKMTLSTAALIEITARAAGGDSSWREWLEQSRDLRSAVSGALMKSWGAALEASARGESQTMAIRAEIDREQARLGPAMSLAGLKKEAKERFKPSPRKGDDLGRGAAFLAALDEALSLSKQDLEASARGAGLSGKLLERRDIARAAQPASESQSAEKPKGSSRL